jgi:2-oxoglutarate dehydrogenase E2 component (dihydrolipoamide succinyltransferase)
MTTAVEVRAPAEQTEGTRSQVLRWLKNVGEAVTENEPLIEIETDKVTVEVASPGSGILREIVKGEQEEIAPGEVLGRIESGDGGAGGGGGGPDVVRGGGAAEVAARGGEAVSSVGVGGASGLADAGDGHAAEGADAASGDRKAGVAHVRGVGRAAAIADVGGGSRGAGAADAEGVGRSAGAADGAGASRTAGVADATGVAGANAASTPGFAAGRLSPAVRRLLSEHSLDPATIRGTGQGGRITVEDVLAAIAAASGAAHANGAHSASATIAPSSDVTGGSHRIPHSAVRKRIAGHMVQSLLHTAPHVTTVFEADMTAVLAHRQAHRDEFAKRAVPLTLTAYFLQATVDAIGVVPEANSRWTDSALEVFDSIHIGVATALEQQGGGLVVPVLRDVQSRDLFTTAQGLNDLVVRAREGRLTPADVRGGTFTISNHGVSGSLVATPIIINQPQSAILGVGKLEKRAVVVDEGGEERVAIRPRCYVTLTIDHRVMDGHQANRFLQTFVTRLTNWM